MMAWLARRRMVRSGLGVVAPVTEIPVTEIPTITPERLGLGSLIDRQSNFHHSLVSVIAGAVLLSGCYDRSHLVTDFCAAEGRKVPDREKFIRFLTWRGLDYRQIWQIHAKGAEHFRLWMDKAAPDPSDEGQVVAAIGQYIGQHPKFIQLVERDPDLYWTARIPTLSRDRAKSYAAAEKKGYYSDIIIMGGNSENYPTYESGQEFNLENAKIFQWRRLSITNCGNYIHWDTAVGKR